MAVDSRFSVFELSKSFSKSVQIFIKIGQDLGILEHFLDFQDGGGGHLDKNQ